MREGRCISLIERLKHGSELKSTLSIGKLFQRFMTRSVKLYKPAPNFVCAVTTLFASVFLHAVIFR